MELKVIDPESEEVSLWIENFTSALSDNTSSTSTHNVKFHKKTPRELQEIKRTQSEPIAEKMLDRIALEWDRPELIKDVAVFARAAYFRQKIDIT